MNFPYETEKSYLYGGNCLIMEVNPSVPNKPISKKSRIFASDYQYMETDIITVSDFEMRPVDYMLARSIEHAKAEPFQWKKEKFTKRKPHPFGAWPLSFLRRRQYVPPERLCYRFGVI